MKTSKKGIALIEEFESCMRKIGPDKFKAYIDPVGVLTIGWGHTNSVGRRFTRNTVWTQQECDDALAFDLADAEASVNKLVKVMLTQSEFDALVSFVYNLGAGNFRKSTLLRKINANDLRGAAIEFMKWNRAGGRVLRGLTRRRAAERKLFEE